LRLCDKQIKAPSFNFASNSFSWVDNHFAAAACFRCCCCWNVLSSIKRVHETVISYQTIAFNCFHYVEYVALLFTFFSVSASSQKLLELSSHFSAINVWIHSLLPRFVAPSINVAFATLAAPTTQQPSLEINKQICKVTRWMIRHEIKKWKKEKSDSKCWKLPFLLQLLLLAATCCYLLCLCVCECVCLPIQLTHAPSDPISVEAVCVESIWRGNE